MSGTDSPFLSVVVAIVSDTTEQRADASHLAGCLEALSEQVGAPPMEVIVPYHASVDGIDILCQRFRDVVFVPVDDLKTSAGSGGNREHHDELRARGLRVARGEVVGLLEDHARPDKHWCARVADAHTDGYAAVGGAIENGLDRTLNWAVYYCDFGRYQNPVPPGESAFASDANISYKRSVLEDVRSEWEESFHETVVNEALMSRGQRLALRPDIVVYQHRSGLRLGQALRERFIWGRSYAGTRSQMIGGAKRLLYALTSPLLPGLLALRMASLARKKRRNLGKFVKAMPAIGLLLIAWSVGELVGYITARPS